MTIAWHLPNDGRVFDVCVIGAGPAGIALALACEEAGLSVLVLEAGGMRPENGAPDHADGGSERTAPEFHDPLHLTTRQAFGGSSWAWGGQCVRFNEVDFAERPWVPNSGWPIGLPDVEPFYGPAMDYLDCAVPQGCLAGRPEDGLAELPDIDAGAVLRCSRRPRLAERYRSRIHASRLIHLALQQTVVGIELDADGERVAGAQVASGAGTAQVPRARTYVIAAGGVKSAHLLLCLQRSWPRHFGGLGGPLGRFYMGHVAGEIATIAFADPQVARHYLFRSAQGLRHQRLFRLAPTTQRSRETLNTAFMLRLPPFADSRHGSGLLSLLHLAYPGNAGWTAFRSPGLRDVIRRRTQSRDARSRDRVGHLRNVGLSPLATVRDASTVAATKIVARGSVPLLAPNPGGRYTLRYHAEQAPDPENRVRLGNDADRHGVPPLVIDFRYAQADARSIVVAHEAMDRSLRSTGQGHLEYWDPPELREAAVLDLAVDGYHQIGTVRMGADPATSVVDSDGRVHGLCNLFVASSGVFPTSGYANPTLTIVALALRTAVHVARTAQQAVP